MAHKEIKTYRFSDSAANQTMFALKKLGELYQEGNGESDSPHRHDYYTIIFIEKGEGVHFVDFTEYEIGDNSIFFILPGQMHQLMFASEPKGWVLIFTEEFLLANAISEKLVNDIYLFNDYGQSPPLPVSDEQMPVYQNIISQMELFSSSLESYTLEALGSLLKVFLIQSNNHCTLLKQENPQLIETSNHLLRSFKKLLNENYASLHMVSDYADLLAVTPDYLNKTIKSITGKSAKEHIQSKLIIEAKRSLLFSNLSGKELSYELGFEETAHFNNFFKKTTGLTPGEFRLSLPLS